ncbi:unnamed protein product [Amoebophrya sp. A120]|nr:unnamed protein product [Amoebophrya sp. A120]|eukprot:GSA120T00021768001.1
MLLLLLLQHACCRPRLAIRRSARGEDKFSKNVCEEIRYRCYR